jgi:hypothetical protein
MHLLTSLGLRRACWLEGQGHWVWRFGHMGEPIGSAESDSVLSY